MQFLSVNRLLLMTTFFLIAIQILFLHSGYAQSEKRPVNVAVENCPPFVMKEAGEFTGLGIFLWENIAKELALDYRIDAYNLEGMLEAVVQEDADIAVHCLSITPYREEIIDFSQPYYQTHLAIAVKQHGFFHAIKVFLSNTKIFVVLGTIIGLSALIGAILFLLEHKVNDKLYAMKNRGGKLVEAFITGLLFLTPGPIRYYEFRTLSGRIISAFLAVGSTLIIASITALLASAFTLDQLRSDITGPQDLSKVKVGVMEATTSFEYLQEHGITGQVFKDPDELLTALDDGRLDAVVWDSAILRYKLNIAQKDGKHQSLSVLPFEFEKQLYAFGIPDGSPYREKLNRTLLTILNSPAWEAEILKFLGK